MFAIATEIVEPSSEIVKVDFKPLNILLMLLQLDSK